jgi:copper chaperone
MSQIDTLQYIVHGMTCSHCVLSVREAVSDVAGVSAVDVDLPSGRMTVSGQDIRDDAVRAAVAGIGYDVAS